MKRLYYIFVLFASISLSCNTKNDDFVTIQGSVTDRGSGNELAGAAVVVSSPAEFFGQYATTDSAGNYLFSELNISEPTDFSFQASLSGYTSASKSITALPQQTVLLDFELVKQVDGQVDNPDDDLVVVGDIGVPAAIILQEVSSTSININETGGEVSTTFSFLVQDSTGKAMDSESSVNVYFQILNGPDGGETVVPEVAKTNSNGVAVTSLFSGDSAGVVRVEAYLLREDGQRISSSPVIISIHGGFPHPDHFFVAPVFRNIEGYGYLSESLEYLIGASVGDKFGNPVKEGTSVDFRSVHAGIINGSATTNTNGFASVSFFANGSTPSNHPNGIGFFDVRAHTIDENNNDLFAYNTLLLTTRTANITFVDANFEVPPNGSDIVRFTVNDLNGYPMAAGTKITVEAGGNLNVSGDADITLGDHFVGGDGVTSFTVTLADLDDTDSRLVPATLTVTVTTPSGYETTKTIQGTRQKVVGQ